MLNLYITQKMPFGVESEFPYKLNEDDTFATLKRQIAEKTGVDPAQQELSIGVPPKYKLSDIEDFSDEWTLNMLLSDHTCMTLEVEEYIRPSHQSEYSDNVLAASFDESYRPDLDPDQIRKHIYFIRNILSPEECASLIKTGEMLGFRKLFNTNPNYRTNTRVVVDDNLFAAHIFKRIREVLPEERENIDGSNWQAVGCNNHFRLCKYVPGQFFDKHEDAYFARTDDEVSFYTVNLYLNEEFERGATRFFKDRESEEAYERVKPEMGSALIFEHFTQSFLHDGEQVEDGTKYLLRTDVMYQRIKPEKRDSSNGNMIP